MSFVTEGGLLTFFDGFHADPEKFNLFAHTQVRPSCVVSFDSYFVVGDEFGKVTLFTKNKERMSSTTDNSHHRSVTRFEQLSLFSPDDFPSDSQDNGYHNGGDAIRDSEPSESNKNLAQSSQLPLPDQPMTFQFSSPTQLSQSLPDSSSLSNFPPSHPPATNSASQPSASQPSASRPSTPLLRRLPFHFQSKHGHISAISVSDDGRGPIMAICSGGNTVETVKFFNPMT